MTNLTAKAARLLALGGLCLGLAGCYYAPPPPPAAVAYAPAYAPAPAAAPVYAPGYAYAYSPYYYPAPIYGSVGFSFGGYRHFR